MRKHLQHYGYFTGKLICQIPGNKLLCCEVDYPASIWKLELKVLHRLDPGPLHGSSFPLRQSLCLLVLLSIWRTTTCQFRTLFSDSTCIWPAVIKSPSHATGSACTAVGLFCCLSDRLELTVERHAGFGVFYRQLHTVTDWHWRHSYFRSTSVFSALEVCYENALYKFTFDIDIDIDIGSLTEVLIKSWNTTNHSSQYMPNNVHDSVCKHADALSRIPLNDCD